MKIRTGFVSNSSSASFVVYADKINALQKLAILNAREYAKDVLNMEYTDDADGWTIKIEGNKIIGDTYMDNFSFVELFDAVGMRSGEHYEYEHHG